MDICEITIDDFAKIEIRVGKVVKAENVEKSEKLIELTVLFDSLEDQGSGAKGQEEIQYRTIYTGVRGYGYTPEDFANKKFLFVTNLKPRKMPGGESQGMILAVSSAAGARDKQQETSNKQQETGEQDKPLFISAEGLPVGVRVR